MCSKILTTKRKSRSPHGERGLKYTCDDVISNRSGRSPHGERGLKFVFNSAFFIDYCRSPHGERGLKFGDELHKIEGIKSLSSRRAWIEMQKGSV